MAKLTVSFKGRPLAVHRLDRPALAIGRAPDCHIVIDSLAVAPLHAEIRQDGDAFVLVAPDPAHRVFRNGLRVEQATLADGDLLLVGKHTLTFSDAEQEAVVLPAAVAPRGARRDLSQGPAEPVPVYLQIQSGPRLGQVIPLPRSVTRLAAIGGHEVIVTRREGRYLLARIGEANRVFVDRRAVLGDQEVELSNGSRLDVDGIRCRFFCPDVPQAPALAQGGQTAEVSERVG